MRADEAVAVLTDALGADFKQWRSGERELWGLVGRDSWRRGGEVCKEALGCRYFTFLSGIDWLPNPDLDGEHFYDLDREPTPPQEVVSDETVRCGTARFQVFAHVYNHETQLGITLFSDLDDGAPSVDSWVPVFAGADWHERETWEMFGFQFNGHPGLRHIYLPEGFEGFPLRKDFPLLARMVRPWPGLVDMEEMPQQDDAGATTSAAPGNTANGDDA